jgi:glycosyltransferase involved in cell wall biosynthesis
MKVVIASSFVPFVLGGGRFIVDWLELKLRERGHDVEKLYLPFEERPEVVLENLAAYRMLDIAGYGDRLIAIRPPAHTLLHPNKVVWFIHHLRGYYDLADTEYSPLPRNASGRALQSAIVRHDTAALGEARSVFTNSKIVGRRLNEFNGVSSEVLYPPLFDTGIFRCERFGDEIVSVCRVEHHKRQHLMVEAMAHVTTPVRLRICGASSNPDYAKTLKTIVQDHNLHDRVALDLDWVSEDVKASLLSRCLANVYVPVDEDSYGYPTLEAAAASKPTITAHDSGGTLEFIEDGKNGLVAEPTPKDLARAFDRVFSLRVETQTMGSNAQQTVADLNINWDHVVERLLA